MSTKQPSWNLVAQLGDRHPLEYGGLFVYVDQTGVYAPEVEKLIVPEEADSPEPATVYRFILEPCTFINGILSDNKFHPDHPAWFADSIGSIANSCGTPPAELVDMLCNGNVQSRATAWDMIGQYHGYENLDQYPLRLTAEEAQKRYADETVAA